MSNLPLLRYETAASTDRGKVRRINQDAIFYWQSSSAFSPPRALLALADGMGGHQAGEQASRLALEQVQEIVLPKLEQDEPIEETAELLTQAVKQANQAIKAYALEHEIDTEDIGTTIEIVVVAGMDAWVAHVGDSRTYILRKHGLDQITVDHTAVAEMVAAGIIEPEEIYTHPQRNILTRAVGGDHFVEVDINQIKIALGERILLCSDGLWGTMYDNAIERMLLAASPPEEVVAELILAANEAGGADNISVVVCDILPA